MIYLEVTTPSSPNLDCSNVAHWVGREAWGWGEVYLDFPKLRWFSPKWKTPWFLFKEDNLLGAPKQKLSITSWPPTLSRTGNALRAGTTFGMHRAQEECFSKPQLARPQIKCLVQERSQWTELGLKRNIQPSTPHHGCQARLSRHLCTALGQMWGWVALCPSSPRPFSEASDISHWFTCPESPFIRRASSFSSYFL